MKYLIILSVFLSLRLSVQSQNTTYINDDVNMRINPSTRSKVMQKLTKRTKVKVLNTTSYRQVIWMDKEKIEKQWVYVELDSNIDIKGWVYGLYVDIESPTLLELNELDSVNLTLLKPKGRTIIPRTFKRNFKKNADELNDIAYPRNVNFSIKNDSLIGYSGRYEVIGKDDYERIYGKVLRALRFKNITDAVEERYNLPSGITLAMIMQESSGEPLMLNGRDDGGAGLAHMQPSVAKEYSLTTLNDASGLVNKVHGKELRYLVTNIQKYVAPLMMLDDRLNWLKNIDAVGRMLSTFMSAGANQKYGGVLESMIARYSGAYNFKTYFSNINFYMKLLNDDLTYNIISDQFNRDNKGLIINNKKGEYNLTDYLKAYWQFNEDLFQLDEYRKLTPFAPYHSYEVLLKLPKGWQKGLIVN